MAYCRWSSDGHKCDLYVYESNMGFEIHVAGQRIIGEVPPFPCIEDGRDGFAKKALEYHKFFDTCKREPIGLPHDGESFICDSLEEMREKIIELREVGYCFPDYVLESIDEELAEVKSE